MGDVDQIVRDIVENNSGGVKMKNLEARITRDFFKKDAVTVAQHLLGREIVRYFPNNTEARGRILEVSAWEGTYGQRPQKFPDYKQGVVSVSCKRGRYMIDITCGDKDSCVTLLRAEFEIDGRKYHADGTSKLVSILQVTPDAFDGYDIVEGSAIKIEGAPGEITVYTRNKGNVPKNCRGFHYTK